MPEQYERLIWSDDLERKDWMHYIINPVNDMDADAPPKFFQVCRSKKEFQDWISKKGYKINTDYTGLIIIEMWFIEDKMMQAKVLYLGTKDQPEFHFDRYL